MRNTTRRRAVAIIFTTLGSIGLAFIFQNCAGGLSSDTESASSSASSNAPFAFDISVDTISYMSCSSMSNEDPTAYYSFRAAALGSNAGVKLSSKIRDYVGDRFAERYLSVIQSSKSQEAQAQLSIRGSDGARQLQSVMGDKNGNVRLGEHVGLILGPLDSEAIVKELWRQEDGVRSQFLSTIPGLESDRAVAGQIRYLHNNDTAGIRADMNGSSGVMMALTYGSLPVMGNELMALSDFEDKTKQAYGRGYFMEFGQQTAADSLLDRELLTIREESLEEVKGEALQWSCPNLLKFKIVREEDAVHGRAGIDPVLADSSKTYCRKGVDPYLPGSNAAFDVVRGILDPDKDDWYIDLHNMCVIAKKDSGYCYGTLQNNSSFKVIYNGTCVDGTSQAQCPHFVSICTRTAIPTSSFQQWLDDGVVNW
ncbi:MAG: hypothetical protein KDD50_14680 [Bdellovibrionales bacterium]|nr:hypothetical protein [Bdellovibrionales bacterium]